MPLLGMAIEILEQFEAEKKKLDFVDVETFNQDWGSVCIGTDLLVPKCRDGRRIRLQYCGEKCRSDRGYSCGSRSANRGSSIARLYSRHQNTAASPFQRALS